MFSNSTNKQKLVYDENDVDEEQRKEELGEAGSGMLGTLFEYGRSEAEMRRKVQRIKSSKP